MNKKIFVIIFLLTCFGIAQTKRPVYHPFTGTLVFTVDGGVNYGLTEYKDFALDYYANAGLEYFFPTYAKSSFGFRAFARTGFLRGKDESYTPNEFRTELKMIGGGVVYLLSIGEAVFPYLFFGASNVWFDPKGPLDIKLPNNLLGVYKKQQILYNGELGLRIMLAENLTLNVNGGINIASNDYLDDVIGGTQNDLFFNGGVGLSFAFFGERDSDGDGIFDSKDNCPESPEGIRVDKFGCPIDTDRDGVADFIDNCRDTPEGVKVNRDGCPVDSDLDLIPDFLDICQNTPRNVKVDEYGCPLDSDYDGVADYLDKCENTPLNVQVDNKGCPVDTDGDTVPDYLDKCPNSPKGVQVDKEGCQVITEREVIKEVPVQVIKEVVLSAAASFQIGKFVLLPAAFIELDKLVKVMKDDKNSRWLIEGHTDNTGSYESNKKLSLNRAKSVLNYFVSKGIDKKRFDVRGLGPDFPVGNNKTEEGRAQNRRVKIIRIN